MKQTIGEDKIISFILYNYYECILRIYEVNQV